MRVIGDTVVIENKTILEFLKTNDKYTRDLEFMIETMCRTMMNGDRDTLGENIFQHMSQLNENISGVKGCISTLRDDIDKMLRGGNESLKGDIQSMTDTLIECLDNESLKDEISTEIKKVLESDATQDSEMMLSCMRDAIHGIEATLKGCVSQENHRTIDVIKDKMSTYWDNISLMNRMNINEISKIDERFKTLYSIHDKLSQVDEKLNSIAMNRSASKKGQDGERDILDILSDKLPSRNGYNVESVRGVANNCDIIVRCEGYENIHIDVKNYEAGGKIRTNVVEKFRNDLIGLNVSGIMVSLWSGIVSKGDIEIEQLPTGKFAIYVSNTGMNIDSVIEFIFLLHKLEKFSSREGVMMTTDMISKIRNIVTDTVRRTNDIKSHLLASLATIQEMNIAMVNNLLMNPVQVKEPEKVVHDKSCPVCGKEFSTKQKCKDHMDNNICKKA
jgi:hypothetical protein